MCGAIAVATFNRPIKLTRRRALIGTIIIICAVILVLLTSAHFIARPTRLVEAIAIYGLPTALYNCYINNVSNGEALRVYFGDHLKITVRPDNGMLDQHGEMYGDLTPFSVITDIDKSADRLAVRSLGQMEWGPLPWHGFGTYPLMACL